MHQHFDKDNVYTGVTLVKREPEWDDTSRDDLLALAEYETGICNCGFHTSLTKDKRNHFDFEEDTCPVCAGSAQWSRVQADADETFLKTLGKDPLPRQERPSDGRRTLIRIKSDEEVAAEEQAEQVASRSPAEADLPAPG